MKFKELEVGKIYVLPPDSGDEFIKNFVRVFIVTKLNSKYVDMDYLVLNKSHLII